MDNNEKTLKQLLTEPYRVQKKNGYRSVDSLRQNVLKNISKFLPQILNLPFSRFMEMADYTLGVEHTDFYARQLIGAINFFLFLKTRPPIFYLDKDLMAMLSNTNPPDSVAINRILLPSFLLLMPNNSLIDGAFFRIDTYFGTEALQLTTMAHDRSPTLVAAMKSGKNYPIYSEQDSGVNVFGVANLLNNFLLWQQSMHDKKEKVIELDAPTRKMGFGKKSKQIIIPRVIGEGYKPKVIRRYETTGTHASPRTHWRSGHWRQHMIGSRKNPEYKTIWVEPTLVNG